MVRADLQIGLDLVVVKVIREFKRGKTFDQLVKVGAAGRDHPGPLHWTDSRDRPLEQALGRDQGDIAGA